MKGLTRIELILPAKVETIKAALSSLPDDAVVAIQVTQMMHAFGSEGHPVALDMLIVTHEEEV